MTEKHIELSRRTILAGMGAVGAAGAGAGLGTSALFSDEETFEGNTLAAGALDLRVDWEEHYFDGLGNLPEDCEAAVRLLADGEEPDEDEVGFPQIGDPVVAVARADLGEFMRCTTTESFGGQRDDPPDGVVSLEDVKPGDFGELTICYGISDNPGYVQLDLEELADDENDIVEPESAVDETAEDGELGEMLRAAAWYDPNGNNRFDGADEPLPDADEGSPDPVLVEGASLAEVVGAPARLDPGRAGGSAAWRVDDAGCHVPGLDCTETLYLSDTGGENTDSDFEGATKLFAVDLQDGDPPVAELSELPASPLPDDDFAQVDAIAAPPEIPSLPESPIGPAEANAIYVVDKESAHLGRYDLEDDTFDDLGPIDGIDPGDQIVLLAFDPEGTLWAVGQSNGDGIFRFDAIGSSPAATRVASTSGVDVQGADIAYDSSGTLYLYSSDDGRLYTVDRPSGTATPVGSSQDDKGSFTGLAIRAAGTGDLVGSSEGDNAIHVLDKLDGSQGTTYEMRLAGEEEAYPYGYGDMTVDQLCPEYCIALEWWLPRDVGNGAQSDAYEFELTLRTEQCRHNDDPFAAD